MSRTRRVTLANLVSEFSLLPKTYVVYMPSSCPAHNSLCSVTISENECPAYKS